MSGEDEGGAGRVVGWGEAFKDAARRYAVAFGSVFTVALATWLVEQSSGTYGLWAIVFLCVFMMLLVLLPMFLNDVATQVKKSKRTVRRLEFEEAATRIGAMDVDVELSLWDKIKRVVWDSKGLFAFAALIEFFLSLPLIGLIMSGDLSNPFNVVLGLAFALPVPLYVLWKLRMNLHFDDTGSLEAMRAERAYREAVKDRAELAGGLALDEHARQVGGELTMQQEAGGLEVHDEVALDFEEEHAEVAAEQEVAVRSDQ